MLELRSPEGAFELIEATCASAASSPPAARSSRPTSTSATGSRSRCAARRRRPRRSRAPCPSQPCPCGTRRGRDPGHVRSGTSGSASGSARWSDAEYAEAVEAVRAAIARGDVYQVNLVQHLAAPFAGDPGGAGRPARRLRAPHDGRRRLGDRLRLAGALPRPPRPASLDVPDQGNAAARRARRGGEGRGRARDDRRPRAQRPLPRLRAGLRALAGADGGARAGRRDAPRLDGRGNAARGRRRPRRAARGDLPGRLGHRRAQDRSARPDRRARAGRPRRLDGRARHRCAETATSTSR